MWVQHTALNSLFGTWATSTEANPTWPGRALLRAQINSGTHRSSFCLDASPPFEAEDHHHTAVHSCHQWCKFEPFVDGCRKLMSHESRTVADDSNTDGYDVVRQPALFHLNARVQCCIPHRSPRFVSCKCEPMDAFAVSCTCRS